MNKVQAALSRICSTDRLREKVLIVPSFSTGHQISESIVRLGTPYINLRISTVLSIAHEIVATDLASESISLLPDTAVLFFIEEIFNELKQEKNSYFAKVETKEGIVRTISDAIYRLRMNGSKAEALKPDDFVDQRKGAEIKTMLQRYEAFLKEKKHADTAELLIKSKEKLTKNKPPVGDRLYLVLSDVPFAVLEKAIIDLLPGEKIFLPYDLPVGLPRPERYLSTPDSEGSKPVSNIELLPWLFAPEGAPATFGDSTVKIKHAVGKRNEVREVFRMLLTSEVRSDEVEIIHTSFDDYVPLIYETAVKHGIGITSEEGLPVSFTYSGRAALGLISWIASNYEAVKFRKLITSGCLNLKTRGSEDLLSPSVMGRIIRDSGIGWSLERYCPILEKMATMYADRASDKDEESEGLREQYLRKQCNAGFLAAITKELLRSVPVTDSDGKVSIGDVCRFIGSVFGKYARISGELDAAAKTAIDDKMDEVGRLSNQRVLFSDALNRIEMMIREIRIGQSGPVPGYLHISSYKRGGRSGRAHTCILGCDSQLFPGGASQNPILLDTELQSISSDLITSSDQLKENIYRMAVLLASLRGQLTLTFSSYDVLDNREAFPSSLLLQIYRLISAKSSADYTDLINALGPPAGYLPHTGHLDSLDFWISTFITEKGIRKIDDQSIALYPGLAAGIMASSSKESDQFTVYDGMINPVSVDLDPRENRDLIMSASRIEKFASCPYGYFLHYVLKVRPLDEIIVSKGEWLDPMMRGKLLHELFQRFMKEITDKKEKPTLKTHRNLIEDIAMELIKTYRDEIPPPGDAVFEQERKRILKTAEVFLRVEEEHCKTCTPLYFELAFGNDDEGLLSSETEESLKDSGKDSLKDLAKDPVEISLDKGRSIRMRGRIDRIDKVGDNEYEIWDYKTGSTYGHKDDGVFSAGKTVQHALYACAAESILQKAGIDESASVRGSGYLFPTEKGTGKRLLRGRDDKGLTELLNAMFDLVKAGIFLPSAEKSSCTFCDYKNICGSDMPDHAKRKISNATNVQLEGLRRMKNYV